MHASVDFLQIRSEVRVEYSICIVQIAYTSDKECCIIRVFVPYTYGISHMRTTYTVSLYTCAAAEKVVDMMGGWADPEIFL